MNGLKKYWIIGGILLIIYLCVQYYQPKATNWTPTYLADDKNPYGTYILNKRIADIFPNVSLKTVNAVIYNNLKSLPKGTSNYFIIGSTITVDRLSYKEMIKYMEAGNNILIGAYKIDGVLAQELKFKISSNYRLQQKNNTINFVNPALKRADPYEFDKGISEQYFKEFDTTRAVVLGNMSNSEANFIKYKFGKGALFILPNPQLLTNYSLLKPDGNDYASKVLSHLPNAESFIWDEHFTRPSIEDQSILRVIFKNTELRWAYYLAIFGLLTFVLFEIKRRQRIIPEIDQLKNTTVEFVEVVGRVYYQQRNNTDLAEKKINYFLEKIRQKYRLKTQELDVEFSNALVKITSVDEDLILELLQEIKNIRNTKSISDKELVRLNQLMEKFYQQDQ